MSVAQEPKHHIQWKWGTIRSSQTASGQLSTHGDNIQGYLTMSESPSSTMGPRWDGLKQPLDLTDSNSRALDLTDTNSRPFAARKMRWPSRPLWIHTGWYATPDTTVLKAQLVVVILGDCPGLYKKDRQTEGGGGGGSRCVTSPLISAWLASLWQPCLCVCLWAYTICMSILTAPPVYPEGKTGARDIEDGDTQKHQWAFDCEPCIISRFISQLWRNRIIPVFGFQ